MYYCLIETLLKYIVAPLPVRRAFRSRAMPAASANAACMASGRGRGTRLPALAGTKKTRPIHIGRVGVFWIYLCIIIDIMKNTWQM